MSRPRAADNFPAIRARIEELRRERSHVLPPEPEPVAAPRRILSLDNPNLDPKIRRLLERQKNGEFR